MICASLYRPKLIIYYGIALLSYRCHEGNIPLLKLHGYFIYHFHVYCEWVAVLNVYPYRVVITIAESLSMRPCSKNTFISRKQNKIVKDNS